MPKSFVINRTLTVLLLFYFLIQLVWSQKLTPDSFAYIDGAKNLLSYGKYSYDANGQPITFFPPLYSIFIASAMWIFGMNAFAIVVLNSLLFILAFYLINHFRGREIKSTYVAVFFNFLVLYTLFRLMNSVLSESLFIVIFLFWLLLQNDKFQINQLSKLTIIFILEIALISTRYTGILFLFAWYLSEIITIVLIDKKISGLFEKKTIRKFISPLAASLYFIWIRSNLGETNKRHEVYLGSGKYTFFEYLKQIVSDFGNFFTGEAVGYQLEMRGLLIYLSISLVTLFLSLIRVKINKKIGIFIFSSLAIHLFTFSNVWIEDALSGRFLIWLYVTLFLFAEFNWKNTYKSFVLYTLPVFFAFLLASNNIYFFYKNSDLIKSNEFHYQIALSDSFKNGFIYSDTIRKPQFNFYGDRRFLISPCYSWNLKK